MGLLCSCSVAWLNLKDSTSYLSVQLSLFLQLPTESIFMVESLISIRCLYFKISVLFYCLLIMCSVSANADWYFHTAAASCSKFSTSKPEACFYCGPIIENTIWILSFLVGGYFQNVSRRNSTVWNCYSELLSDAIKGFFILTL